MLRAVRTSIMKLIYWACSYRVNSLGFYGLQNKHFSPAILQCFMYNKLNKSFELFLSSSNIVPMEGTSIFINFHNLFHKMCDFFWLIHFSVFQSVIIMFVMLYFNIEAEFVAYCKINISKMLNWVAVLLWT